MHIMQQAPGIRCMCTHQMAALFCPEWRHSRHQIINMSPSVDEHLLKEQLCRISSRTDLKWQSLRLFLNDNKTTTTARSVAIWDQFLIHSSWLKTLKTYYQHKQSMVVEPRQECWQVERRWIRSSWDKLRRQTCRETLLSPDSGLRHSHSQPYKTALINKQTNNISSGLSNTGDTQSQGSCTRNRHKFTQQVQLTLKYDTNENTADQANPYIFGR